MRQELEAREARYKRSITESRHATEQQAELWKIKLKAAEERATEAVAARTEVEQNARETLNREVR